MHSENCLFASPDRPIELVLKGRRWIAIRISETAGIDRNMTSLAPTPLFDLCEIGAFIPMRLGIVVVGDVSRRGVPAASMQMMESAIHTIEDESIHT